MLQIFIGSFVLSCIHASIPNHWMPIIALAKSEKWSLKDSLMATVITGFAHTLSTVIIGIIVGFIGYKLADSYLLITTIIAPSILVGLGVIYVLLDIWANYRHHHHEHSHFNIDVDNKKNKSKWAILTTLSIAMFLTPCVELEAYYFQAGSIGWTGIFIVSLVYTFTTVIFMLVLVYLGLKGINKLKLHYMEHHEKQITGLVLIVIGIFSYFVN